MGSIVRRTAAHCSPIPITAIIPILSKYRICLRAWISIHITDQDCRIISSFQLSESVHHPCHIFLATLIRSRKVCHENPEDLSALLMLELCPYAGTRRASYLAVGRFWIFIKYVFCLGQSSSIRRAERSSGCSLHIFLQKARAARKIWQRS